MTAFRELPPPDELLRPRDHEPSVVIPPHVWHCLFCQPDGPVGAATTVTWIGPDVDAPHGRCMDCGQKYELASESWMKLRAGMPVETTEDRRHCRRCQPDVSSDAAPLLRWRDTQGECARCGQRYREAT